VEQIKIVEVGRKLIFKHITRL